MTRASVPTSRPRERVWWLNLDADIELSRPNQYATSRVIAEQLAQQRERLEWLVCGERVVDARALRGQYTGALAWCWCPTPSALAALEKLGLESASAPPLEVLQRVNDRRFQMRFASVPELERAFVEPGDALDWLASPGAWRLKRAHGFAGKGQRVVRQPLSEDDQRWIRDSAERGFLRERQLELREEWALHAWVDAAGLLLGQPCRQWCDGWGRVVRLERARLAREPARALSESAEQVARALTEAGYFGPFGIDAFSAETAYGSTFNALGEINARFSLGWSIGMGELREEALQRGASR